MGGSLTAARMVWDIRTAMEASPSDLFWSVDCTNAFGSIHRSTVLAATDRHAPHFARLLRATWSDVSPVLLIDQAGQSAPSAHAVIDA